MVLIIEFVDCVSGCQGRFKPSVHICKVERYPPDAARKGRFYNRIGRPTQKIVGKLFRSDAELTEFTSNLVPPMKLPHRGPLPYDQERGYPPTPERLSGAWSARDRPGLARRPRWDGCLSGITVFLPFGDSLPLQGQCGCFRAGR